MFSLCFSFFMLLIPRIPIISLFLLYLVATGFIMLLYLILFREINCRILVNSVHHIVLSKVPSNNYGNNKNNYQQVIEPYQNILKKANSNLKTYFKVKVSNLCSPHFLRNQKFMRIIKLKSIKNTIHIFR